jgi:hypothetical protein
MGATKRASYNRPDEVQSRKRDVEGFRMPTVLHSNRIEPGPFPGCAEREPHG